MSVKVKICGITNVPDALAAVEAGADMIGLMFCDQSPRFLSIEAAASMVRELPSFVVKAGVFANAPEELVLRAIRQCNLNVLQFHGDETPQYCDLFDLMIVKAFRIRDAESLKALPSYQTDAWLLDAYSPNQLGGTGARFNWDLAVEARKLGRPLFLAGGLTAENVVQAVETVRPQAVDVSSGVESAPGKKDPAKMRAFVQAAKSVAG
jgi:phosphoribosylanthranilate isomerase